MLTDTIVALATPRGQGALGIVRLSGAESLRLAGQVFRGKKNFARVVPRSAMCSWLEEWSIPR